MDRDAIDAILDAAEGAVEAGDPVRPSGFWKAVGEIKRRPDLVDSYADRVAVIDQRAFRLWALLVVPLWSGTALMVFGTAVGLALIWWAYFLTSGWAAIAFLTGVGVILVTTHGLAHLVVGRLVGIRFTNWFIGTWAMPQPGVKTDYSTYLRTPARARAWMHASGAIMTKAIPWLLLGAAFAADIPRWVPIVLVVVGLATLLTDILWSTSSSDWKKFKREMGFAQSP